MKAEDLFREGKLEDAIRTLGAELRDDPSNAQKRTFLFELLAFAGEYDRAEKQLDLLGDLNNDAMLASLLYRGALSAEQTRQGMFQDGKFTPPVLDPPKVSGSLNGKPFQSISDADPRVGPRLEVIAGGDYLWIGFEHIQLLKMDPPKRLRDLIWATAKLKTGPSFKGQDLGEVLLPALAPGSVNSDEPDIRLGRVTEWFRDVSGIEFPLGRKVLLVDGVEVPLLEVRTLEIQAPETESVSGASQ
jgi:type VI secretion system protein ImpE